jgi:hypothetical protein
MAHDVFVCYSSEDKTIANAACAKLESAGIRCWMAPRDPIAGIPYGRQLVDAITAARIVLLIFSGHANRSEHVLRELEVASDSGKIIVPFRIENVVPSGDLRYYITRVHWLDAMSPPMEARLSELVALMQRLLDLPITPVATAATRASTRKGYPLIAAIVVIAATIAIALGLYFMKHSAPPAGKIAKVASTAKPVKKKTAATHAPAIVAQATPRIVYVTAPPGPPVAIPPPAVSPSKKPHAPKKTAVPKARATAAPTAEPTIAARPPTSVEYRTIGGGDFFISRTNDTNWRVGRAANTVAYTMVGRADVSGTAGTTLLAPSGREWLFVPDLGAGGPYAHQICFSHAGPGTCDANKILPIVLER